MRGPAFYALTRLACRRELRRQGHSFSEITELLDAADDDVIDAAAVSATVEIPPTTGAIGDGTIIRAIVDFLRSEQGQALIRALIALLMGLI